MLSYLRLFDVNTDVYQYVCFYSINSLNGFQPMGQGPAKGHMTKVMKSTHLTHRRLLVNINIITGSSWNGSLNLLPFLSPAGFYLPSCPISVVEALKLNSSVCSFYEPTPRALICF